MPTPNLAKERKLPHHRAAELFKYDPKTGVITNRITRGPNAKAGAVAGWTNDAGYLYVGVNGWSYSVHRLAWLLAYGKWPEDQIDHIDGNKRNNRIDNLRVATQPENMLNRAKPKNNTSGTVGVTWTKPNSKWKSEIQVSGKKIFLGYFSDKADAIKAREAADIQYGFHPNHGRHGQCQR